MLKAAVVAMVSLFAFTVLGGRSEAPSHVPLPAGFARVTVQTHSGKSIAVTFPRRSFTFTPAGRTYWVAPGGSDAGDGSLEAPFGSVARALSVAGPGDLVYLRAGTYPPFQVTKSGAAGKPIIISAFPGELVTIAQPAGWQAANAHSATVTLTGARYVWLHGLTITGCRGQADAPADDHFGQNCITLEAGAGQGDCILNCVTTRAQHCGIKEMGHGGRQFVLEGNVIYGNGLTGLDHGIYCPAKQAVIRGNAVFDNASYGIHLYSSPSQCSIYDNVCFDNGAAGIIVAGPNNVIAHNVCAGNSAGVMLFREGCTRNVFANNVLFRNRSRQVAIDSAGGIDPPSGNVVDHNGVFPGEDAAPAGVAAPGTAVSADPMPVDAGSGDWRLHPGSPAIGAAGPANLVGAPAAPDLGLFPATSFTSPQW